MKFLCSDKSLGRCDMLKALLEANGIECVLKNEYMPFSGSGIGVFSPDPVYPELWVVDDNQYDEAMVVVGDADPEEPGSEQDKAGE